MISFGIVAASMLPLSASGMSAEILTHRASACSVQMRSSTGSSTPDRLRGCRGADVSQPALDARKQTIFRVTTIGKMARITILPQPSSDQLNAESDLLGTVIARGESTASGGYNAYNTGLAGRSAAPIDFSQLTIAEVMALQARRAVFAVGKYQIIPRTLADAVAALEIDVKVNFTPDVQEVIFARYLAARRRPDIYLFVTGKHDDIGAAHLALAKEWAAVAKPGTHRTSYYAGKARNKASITSPQISRALRASRERFLQLSAVCADAEVAYQQAITGIAAGCRTGAGVS